MSQAAQRVPVPGTEHRAFPVYETIPPGCTPWFVPNDRFEPHIHRREQVLINTNDREAEHGEFFPIAQELGPELWQVCIDKVKAVVCVRPLNNNIPPGGIEELIKKTKLRRRGEIPFLPVHMSDGPLKLEYLPKMILGRAIGIYKEPRSY